MIGTQPHERLEMQQVFSKREFTVEIRQPGKEASIYQRCGSHSVARLIAKTLTQRGTRAIVRPARPTDPHTRTNYAVMVFDCESKSIVTPGFRYRSADAIEFWRKWQIDPNNGVVILWPDWAPVPSCIADLVVS